VVGSGILILALCGAPEGLIQTVRGPIEPSALGRTLAHEHVLCDFIGAAETGRQRWDPDEVVAVMRPHLEALKERGFKAFADATPAWIGRDPEVLRRLSELTGLHILTNTGYYGAARDKFLPAHALEESAGELAARWTAEWREGIGGSGIKPGFLKTGVDPGPLSAIDRKLVRAAALAHLETGLTIACHTGEARAALEVLETVEDEGVAAAAHIIVHADSIADAEVHRRLAAAGAWVEYDAVGAKPIDFHVRLIREMIEAGHLERLLISHDAGWFSAGEPGGGREKIRPYTALWDRLVPALREAGVADEDIDKLLAGNPRRAFTIAVRKRTAPKREDGGG
jgi:phosphotriesterase-related protein